MTESWQSNNDFENLFVNTEIAVIFLDNSLTLKRYSPAAASLLNLSPADIGHPLRQLPPFDLADLANDCAIVLRELVTIEREVKSHDRRFNSIMRILPQKISDRGIDGIVITLHGITLRKEVENALAGNAEQLRFFIEQAPASLAMFDTGLRYLRASNRWLEDYGLVGRDVIGTLYNHNFPEISPEWQEALHRGLTGKAQHTKANRFRRADASERWIRWEIQPWCDRAGSQGGIIVFSDDITDVLKAQDALRRFELLAEHSRDIILFVQRDNGRILEANRAASIVYGYTHGELLQLTIHDLRQPGHGDIISSQMAEADLRGILFETTHFRKDGSSLPVEVSSQGATIGDTRILVSVVRDIAARKQAEKEREATVELLHIANASRNSTELTQATLRFFQKFSGCEAVGIRLKHKNQYPYIETIGFTDDFVLSENQHRIIGNLEQPMHHSLVHSTLECICGDVVLGQFDPSKPYFTAKGSFWSNAITDLFAATAVEGRPIRTCHRCNGKGYESVAMIPLKVGDEHLGLLQLNDRNENMFSPEAVAQLERLAEYLSIAIAKIRLDETLRTAKREWERTFDSVPDLITVLDNQHRILRVNKSMAERIGLQPSECIGLRCYEAVHGALCPPKSCPHLRTVADGNEHLAEVHEERLGGDFLVTTTPLFEEDGTRIGSIHVAHDITERKQAEKEVLQRAEELRSSNEELMRFNRASVGRELRMIELKKEINALCEMFGQPPRYPLTFEEEQ